MSKTEQEKLETANGNSKNEIPAKEQGVSVSVTQATDKSPSQKMKTETSVPRKDPVSKEQQELKSQPLSPSGQGHIPTSGDIVVPFEKIKEMAAKKESVKEVEPNGSLDKKIVADKAAPKTESTTKDMEKPLPDVKQQTKPKASRSKAADKVDKQPSQPTKPKVASKTVTTKEKTEQKPAVGSGRQSSATHSSEQTQQSVPSAFKEAACMNKNNDSKNAEVSLTDNRMGVLPGIVSPPVPQAHEKEKRKDQVKEPPAKRRSREREER